MRLRGKGFLVIVIGGLAVRLILAALSPHPGVSDPNHYYNLARNLAAGRGFVIDYIWQYHNPPDAVTHPEDYWMPLAAVWPALGLRLGGNGLFAALLPSVIWGALIPVLAYAIARVARLDRPTRLMAMAGVVFLPEFVLNSVRTDTTISYVLFIGAATLCFYMGLRLNPRWLVLAGVFGGLAQLTRQDGILLAPAMCIALVVFRRIAGQSLPWRWLIAVPVAWGIVLAPWLLRNMMLFGVLLPSGGNRTFFLTSFNEQFTYSRPLDLEHYLAWGWPNILGNIAFQTLANVKTSYTVLDVGLPVMVLIGLGGLIVKRQHEPLLLLATPVLFILALFVFYSFLTPFHSMGGSFKKSYMAIIPYLAVVGAWGIAEYVQPRSVAYVFSALMSVFMLLDGIELTRADFNQARVYDDSMAALSSTLEELGDQNGDNAVTVMAQDPFMLNYHGFPAVMMPFDDRETIIEVARRYAVDYIILPAARPALDSLYEGAETDPRLPLVGRSGDYRLLAISPSG